jgi:hypothetical protein
MICEFNDVARNARGGPWEQIAASLKLCSLPSAPVCRGLRNTQVSRYAEVQRENYNLSYFAAGSIPVVLIVEPACVPVKNLTSS